MDSILKNTFFITIIPNETSPKLTLNAFDGTSLIGSEIFVVKYIPTPKIHLLTQGKQIDSKNGFYGIPKDLTIQAALNEDVQDLISVHPQYKITSFEIRFVKAGTELKKIQVKDNTIDLRTVKNIESAEYLIITINEIKLILPDGQLKNITFGNSILTVPISH
ncbi:MAG TPA: hypothetical protein VK796_09850 [Cytophaga sp.]|nr:hypothetical protein [Cytophaga sp.]